MQGVNRSFMKSTTNFLKGNISKQILIFFFPILLGAFFQQLYNTADALIVGRFVNKESLAAVGATGYIINMLIGFFMGLSAGAGVIISQLYGAGKLKELSDSIHTALALSIVSGLLVMFLGLFLSPIMLRAMNTPEDIITESVTYLRVYFLGSIPVLIYNMASGLLRAVGDSKSPLYTLIVCTVCNIILDIVFVAEFHMGIFGAAFATILAQTISAIIVIIILKRAELSYKLDIKKINFQKKPLINILKVGLPTGFQGVLYSFSNIIVQSAVNSFGSDTVAAWTAFTRIDNFYWMMIASFGIAVTTFVGQNYGARNLTRIKKSVIITLKFTVFSSIFLSLLFYVFSKPLLGLFTADRTVLDLGVFMFRNYCQYYIFFIPIEVLSGAIRGSGESLIPTIITALGVCVLRVVWIIFIIPLNKTIFMVLTTYPLTWGVTALVFIFYYRIWIKKTERSFSC